MWRWLQRTFWRFSSRDSPLWTWGQPTPTSAWRWPAFSPSSIAPPPASSAHRLTVSTAFTPSQQNAQWCTPGETYHSFPGSVNKVQTFLFDVWYPLACVSTYKLLSCTSTVFWQQMQCLPTSHPATCSLLEQLLHSMAQSSMPDVCNPQ